MPELSLQDRLDLSRLIVNLLDGWGASPREQVALLALPEGTAPRALRRYQESTPLPDDPQTWERIEHYVGIAEALRTSYPHSASGARIWMNQPHRLFDGRTPLAAMLEDGIAGVLAVRAWLDCAWDWNQSGSLRTGAWKALA